MKKTLSILTITALIWTARSLCVDAAIEITENGVPASKITKAEAIQPAAGEVQHPAVDFDKQVANGIVILDFFATWCPPCQRFAPTFITAASNHKDMLFIKIDIEKYADLASKYSVRSMPTIVALKDGKEVKRNVGSMSAGQLEKWIKEVAK